MEELRQSLLYTTLELETLRQQVQEEISKRDEQLMHLSDVLEKTMRERDEAQEKCQKLHLEKFLFLQQQQLLQVQQKPPTGQASGVSGIEDDHHPKRGRDSNNGFSSSDSDESIVSSPVIDQLRPPQQPKLPPQQPQPQSFHEERIESLLQQDKPLPEKGKLLQAVMKAGPLLQTLLLAGPLPQWRHPPPPLESFEIPPVTVPAPSLPALIQQDSSVININNSVRVNRKRCLGEGSDSSIDTKYQKIVLH